MVRVETLAPHVEKSDTKCSKTVEDVAQAEKVLRVRSTSLESSPKAERDRIARFEKDCLDENAGGRVVFC